MTISQYIIDALQWVDLLGQVLTFMPMLGCVAIWKPKGVNIKRKFLKNSFENNKHGAGFAYVKDGVITVAKGFFDFNKFYEAFRKVMQYPALVHFRIATHGVVNADNCHPFVMRDGKYALVHNGILPWSFHKGNKDVSDTRNFSEILDGVIDTPTLWGNASFQRFIEEVIGYNKIALLRADGKHWLFNEGLGEWHKGSWYSNDTYKNARVVYTSYKGTGSSAGSADNKRSWSYPQDAKQGESVSAMWQRLGYGLGTKDKPIWSEFNKGYGYYDEDSRFVYVATNGTEADYGDAGFTELGEDGEFQADEVDTQLMNCSEEKLAELEGDLAFIPDTDQERYVQRWLAIQDAKSRGVSVKTADKHGHETPLLDYEPHPFVRTGEPAADAVTAATRETVKIYGDKRVYLLGNTNAEIPSC